MASREWIIERKISLIMVTIRVSVMVSIDWLILMSAMAQFCLNSQRFVQWNCPTFLGLELKHNQDQDVILSLIEKLCLYGQWTQDLVLRLLDADQNLVALRA